jgi:hypothetical protein
VKKYTTHGPLENGSEDRYCLGVKSFTRKKRQLGVTFQYFNMKFILCKSKITPMAGGDYVLYVGKVSVW